MPNEILAVVDTGPAMDDQVTRTAAAFGELLHLDVRSMPIEAVSDPQRAAEAVLAALADSRVTFCVLAAGTQPDALSWQIVATSAKPVVVVPPGARLPRRQITRALLPLDGTSEAALAIARTARLLDQAGVDLVVLHVFDAATVPSFWDQRAHAHRAWTAEFLSRCGVPPSAQLQLRNGRPGAHVVRAAHTEQADIIALGWSRCIDPGRAQTVRESVLGAPVPVLLLPIVPE